MGTIKNPFTREALKTAALNTVCTTGAITHFILQGASDLVVEAESQLVCLIDKGANKQKVQLARKLFYKADKSAIRAKIHGAHLAIIKAKHNIERKFEDIKYGPLQQQEDFTDELTAVGHEVAQ